MADIFLYSNLTPAFAATTLPFIRAAGGSAARIAWLVPAATGWEPFLPRYQGPWEAHGVAEVVPIVPTGDPPQLSDRALATLALCTGIFVSGGDTRAYHALYCKGPAAGIISERHAAGVPYGGLSAGALIATGRCAVWGDRVQTPDNVSCLGGADAGCAAELEMADGLGLLRDLLVEPHFSEQGGFPRLAEALRQSGLRWGLGIDDGICAHVTGGRETAISGQGRAYLVERQGPDRFACRILEPGTRFPLAPE